MVTSFADRWRAKELALGCPEEIAIPMVSFGDCVLPADAAPFLTFEAAARPLPIYEVFGSSLDWSAEDRARLARFLVIGSDSAGNPICVVNDTGKIVLLDHEDDFENQQFVNSSASQLAEFLLAYFGEKNAARFEAVASGIDPSALLEGTFWKQQMKGIRSDA